MTPGTVSCVLPVFNGAAHLRDALDSVLAQRHLLEIVAVDDGSTDASAEILARYAPRVRVVRQANAGPAAARNTGIREARGAFLAFLDQDDRWHPDKLARQMERFERRAHLDVVVSHVESFWDEDVVRGADQPRAGAVPGYISGTMLARRDVFDRIGVFDPGIWYVDSLDWFARAAEASLAIELMPDVLLYHRVHGGNLSRRGEQSRAECLRILKRALDRRRLSAAAQEPGCAPTG